MNYFGICSGICSGDRNERNIKNVIFPLIKPLAMSYLEVFKMLVTGREFFGLRDFYRLHNYDIDKKIISQIEFVTCVCKYLFANKCLTVLFENGSLIICMQLMIWGI